MLPTPSFAPSPFFLFFFLFFLFTPCLSQDNEIYTSCVARSCGDIPVQNISFPFWFEGQSKYCGDPRLKLNCTDDNSTTTINILTERFRVKSIDPVRRTLTLIDEDLAGPECTTPSSNTTIDTTAFHFTTQDLNLTLYYECPDDVALDYSRFFPLPCTPNVADTYAFFTLLATPNASFASCKVAAITLSNSMRRLLPTDKPLLEDYVPSFFEDAVQTGFEVSWESLDMSWCVRCNESGGRCGYNPDDTQQRVCLCRDQPHQDTCDGRRIKLGRNSRSPLARKVIIGASALTGAVVFLVCVVLIFYPRAIFCFTREHKEDRAIENFLKNYGSLVPKRYQYFDLKKMTNSFKDKLGQGGFGGVFKGKLEDGRLVAVKVLSSSKCNGEEFMNEVASIGRTNHVNIVNLLGFCSNRSKRALLYEFMPNGSLEQFIYEKTRKANPLGWKKLYEIALGIAKGLEYLHRGCSTRILHLDIKPHNILLDEDFQPKISDFGLAKICPPKESFVSMLGARGTVGYIAPEVFCRNFGGVSHKSDVYSYEMMVLEMVGGRSNIEATAEKTSQVYFPDWIYKRVELNEHLELNGMTMIEEEEIARKMIIVALWCIQVDQADRPTTRRVVEMLEGTVESLPIPPRPIFSSPSRTHQPHSSVSTS